MPRKRDEAPDLTRQGLRLVMHRRSQGRHTEVCQRIQRARLGARTAEFLSSSLRGTVHAWLLTDEEMPCGSFVMQVFCPAGFKLLQAGQTRHKCMFKIRHWCTSINIFILHVEGTEVASRISDSEAHKHMG